MDQSEAEWLARVIQKKAFTWIQVRGVDFNPLTRRYEITCLYKRKKALLSATRAERSNSKKRLFSLGQRLEGRQERAWRLH